MVPVNSYQKQKQKYERNITRSYTKNPHNNNNELETNDVNRSMKIPRRMKTLTTATLYERETPYPHDITERERKMNAKRFLTANKEY
ncbi:unnamed protein product [Didymodactylos carnosus]|uniref:Uncharacterized protein n=1 Tax=Didymodactylos carnosus TaxID=1234261 RepID=A0A813U8S6_9BILA|nr:unnamed protein product [Didymodactylos carnosus]CAF0969454.1 unnamed protein product [Didymodactylos carnosus]CAF3612076.1 unnamed protein product [Didymodactylos carnosus]CAF3741053.1 unnamed protein product [Didymodactylos carnosus]